MRCNHKRVNRYGNGAALFWQDYIRDMVPNETRRRRQPEVKELVTEEAASPKPKDLEH
jgi:hypothetical protein